MHSLELIAIVLTLALVASILWSTVRTGMPPMPSLGKGRKAMLDAVGEPQGGAIVDMGSGWGTLVIPLARRYPGVRVEGYELSWFPWLASWLAARLLRLSNARFHRRDFVQADLGQVDTVLCYLMPAGMEQVRQRLETAPGGVRTLISHHFAVTGWEPVSVHRLRDLYQTPIYTYRIPDSLPVT